MKKVTCFLGLLMGVITPFTAQQFDWKATIESPVKEGFHDVLLSPELSGKLKTDFSDLRLYDEEHKQVPYLLRTEIPLSNEEIFKDYNILSKEIIKGCCTRLIIHNQNRNNINNISLIIRNSDVQKGFKLSGSDDKKTWYVIKDNYRFSGIYSNQATSEIKLVNFPLSNYRYYKIEVDDSLSPPLNIVKAGYYDNFVEQGKYTEIKNIDISQSDNHERKQSFVRIKFEENRYVDRLVIQAEGPLYYLRKACLARVSSEGDEQVGECFRYFELSSNGNNIINLERIAGESFYLIVDNDDNQPLKIKSIRALQLNTYLKAHLQKNKKYELHFGSENAEAPVYDLKYFEHDIPEKLSVLQVGEPVSQYKNIAENKREQKTESYWLIWTAIILVVLLLSYISFRMIREMRQM